MVASFGGTNVICHKEKKLYNLIEKTRVDCPTIDILVNNAGTIKREKATHIPIVTGMKL
ncbi:MAG: hypothetical protein CM1200mP6_02090 [Anaerolineaceae bacterium]|nr:MAG: hypothetical protein CM1200mP6_02090 [Anaerolineaceae bacterium]